MKPDHSLDPAALSDALWHRSLGMLIEALDQPNFWAVLIRYLGDLLVFESWVVLFFKRLGPPEVCAESPAITNANDDKFREYLASYYLLDPFYLACRYEPRATLLRLDDVAPDNFEAEEYYQRYFRLSVVKDEVQFTLPADSRRVLSLSLGSTQRYSAQDMRQLSAITPWLLALMRQRLRFETPQQALDPLADDAASSPDPGAAWRLELAANLPRGLTLRELEIVHLMLSGNSLKGIAQKLHISPETVKVHRRHIYSKLGVKSHPELFTILIEANALPLRSGGILRPSQPPPPKA